MEPQAPTTVTTTTVSSPGIFGTNIPASAAFIVGILLFLMPFAEIKCGNDVIANQTGVGFAMKKEWKPQGLFDQKDLQKNSATNKDKPLGNSQIIIIAVLVLAVMGLLLSIAKANGTLAGLFGLVSACGLIYFMIDLKNAFNASVKKDATDQVTQGATDAGLGNMANAFNDMKPTLAFSPWFWIAVVIFLAAAIFSWQRGKMRT